MSSPGLCIYQCYGQNTVGPFFRTRCLGETKRNADAFETPALLDDEVRQRGTTVPGHEDWRHLKTRTASLKSIRHGTLSQCNMAQAAGNAIPAHFSNPAISGFGCPNPGILANIHLHVRCFYAVGPSVGLLPLLLATTCSARNLDLPM